MTHRRIIRSLLRVPIIKDGCHDGRHSPCHINASRRILEEATDFVQHPPADDDQGNLGFALVMGALVLVLVLTLTLMTYCALQKHSSYDPQVASRTRRSAARRIGTRNNPAVTNDAPRPPPDPHRKEKIAVNLFYGMVEASGDVETMSRISSTRFTKQKSKFEPRQPHSEDECPICCEPFEEGEEYVISKLCNHMYKKRCIEQWTVDEQKDDCPVCRQLLLFDRES